MLTVRQILKLGLVIPKFVSFFLFFVLVNIGKIVAPKMILKRAKKRMDDAGDMNIDIKTVDDIGFLFSWDMVWMQTRKEVRDILKEAQLDKIAPNPELNNLTTEKSTMLLDLAQKGRPLVLNFGSCT